MPMSYGPLWGLISAGVMLIAGESGLSSPPVQGSDRPVAWIGSLHLVYRLTEGMPQNRRCLAIVVFGWAPAGVSQSLAEGHNDIAMVALTLLWLYLLMRGRMQAPIALAASVLCKYVTAPLFVIDALYALRHRPETAR